MSHPDIIMSVWDDQRNVDTLTRLHAEGKSFAQIALAIGQGVSRNACIGKAKRMKLPRHGRNHVPTDRTSRNTKPLITGKKGRSGNPGVPSVHTIMHRMAGRANVAPLAFIEEGVDATHLIAFADRRIGTDCAWIPGDALDGAMCCGKPVVEGSQWCPTHHARVYPARSVGA